jgi:hypothetical protein
MGAAMRLGRALWRQWQTAHFGDVESPGELAVVDGDGGGPAA